MDLVYANFEDIQVIFTDLNFINQDEGGRKNSSPDGLRLISFIRNFEKDINENPIKIIAFSSSHELEKPAIDAGATNFYLKPLSIDNIKSIFGFLDVRLEEQENFL
ncbi:hypothetical protein DFS34DRAFT_590898 [Phlyctochytrium arcticum]|nr:hypothetical protein DFS34DRAFT_590898 [Phlyctochytrium arcticum]